MNTTKGMRRTGIRDIVRRKGNAPIVCLTAYSAPVAKILDAHTDLLLVGVGGENLG